MTDARDALITRELAKVSPTVRECGPHRWRNPASPESPIEVSARIEDGCWLTLRHAAEDLGALAAPWSLVCLNARLAGLAKLSADAGAASLSLQAEVPIDGEMSGLAARVRAACAGFGLARAELLGKKPGRLATGTAPPALWAAPTETVRDLRDLCDEAGWRTREGAEGRTYVELSGRRGSHRAEITADPDSGFHAWAPILRVEQASEPARHAIGVLLLGASRAVRMARGAVAQGRDGATAGFEICLGSDPGVTEVGHALAALWVACDLCGPELAVLLDDTVASLFVRLRGWCRPRVPSSSGSREPGRGRANGSHKPAGASDPRIGHVRTKDRAGELRQSGLDRR